jgi:hypothetical protein
MTVLIIMKKLYEGEGRGPGRFLLAHIPEISWISCGNSGNFLKSPENMFRSEQGVNPG